MVQVSDVSFEQRAAEKEAARRADDLAIAEGRKSPERIKLESESFAFGPDRARLEIGSLHPLEDSLLPPDRAEGGDGRA